MAAKAVVMLASVDGYRSVTINSDFFTGYKKTALKLNEIVVSIEIPFTSEVSVLVAAVIILVLNVVLGRMSILLGLNKPADEMMT